MKQILISIQPEWVAKILNSEKTIEIRKTKPKCKLPCKVYIYCTKGEKKTYLNYSPCETPNGIICNYAKISNDTMPFGFEVANGKIVAEFTLNKITNLRTLGMLDRTGIIMLMGRMDMGQYENHNGQYAWHIDDLKIYNEPKELGEFGIIKAPQNWCYIEEVEK